MEEQNVLSKSALARSLGISRSSLYYVSRLDRKDWITKTRMEAELPRLRLVSPCGRASHRPGTGPARHAQVRHQALPEESQEMAQKEANYGQIPKPPLLTMPLYPNHVWAADFTEIWYRGRWVYIATVEDLFTRKIVGIAVSLRKGTPLVMQALGASLLHYPRPEIFHSDNGKEYDAKAFIAVLEEIGCRISRSHPGCPWENGYQESFYDKFKLDFGDPKRFKTYGELVAEIYRRMWAYNHTRIHSALRMPPQAFAEKFRVAA